MIAWHADLDDVRERWARPGAEVGDRLEVYALCEEIENLRQDRDLQSDVMRGLVETVDGLKREVDEGEPFVVLHCLVPECPVYVANPLANPGRTLAEIRSHMEDHTVVELAVAIERNALFAMTRAIASDLQVDLPETPEEPPARRDGPYSESP